MTKVKEIWKDVAGYEGSYQVSNLGRVKSLPRFQVKREIILSDGKDSGGYRIVGLSKNGESKTFTVHRLVAIAFIPNPLSKPTVNHKNSIRSDNRVENLEWCTHSENIKHGFKHGLMSPPIGERSGSAKLTESDVLKIRSIYLAGGISQSQLGKMFGVTQTNILRILKKDTWAHI